MNAIAVNRAFSLLAFAVAQSLVGTFVVAGELPSVNLSGDTPQVKFDVPRRVLAMEPLATPGQARLISIELPISMVVAKGDVDRVEEIVIEIDGTAAGLTVVEFAPMTQLESEFTGEIEIRSTIENNHHVDASLGGILPSVGGSVAQLAPSITAGKANRASETETVTRLTPKEAIVVSGAINRRQGVLFKFRPYSQTTLEGERVLSVTFAMPTNWEGGELCVRCRALGERKVLFVKQHTVWSETRAPVELRLAKQTAIEQTVAKPVVEAEGTEEK